MMLSANEEYIIAPRGWGKSEGIDAPRLIRNVFSMPRSSGAFLSPTYSKLLQNTLPAVCHALARFGYIRDRHYYLGRKPPKNLGFEKPYVEPFSYDHVMIWFNGSIQNLVSFDRQMSVNSMNLDYVMGFEAKFLDYDKIVQEVYPALRGNINYFGSCPWHHGKVYSTDMPTSKRGKWIFDMEQHNNDDLIKTIKLTYSKIKELESDGANDHMKRKARELRRDLSVLRRNCSYYHEGDPFDNIEILGADYFRKMKRDLPPILFRTSIMNDRMRKIENGFYSALDENIHCYTAGNNSYLDSLDYNLQASSVKDCRHDDDLDPGKPLILANDYNAAINSLVIGQVKGNLLKTLHSMFVKTPLKLTDLMDKFSEYYRYHSCREVIYYYDSTSIHDTPLHGKSFADTVMHQLTAAGWKVTGKYIGQPMKHYLKHNYIDMALKGNPEYLFPVFNSDNNEYLMLALEQTGVKQGGRFGFEKDKSAEKDADTPDNPDELKTHITDAWDTLFIGCNFHPVSSSMALMPEAQWK